MPFDSQLPFDWFILLLRVLFIFLLYFFLFQIVRTISRDLRLVSLATSGAAPVREETARASAQLVLEETLESGLPAGTTFALRSGAVAGRQPTSAIHLNDTFMSGEHARLTMHEGRWWVADLGSTNGTHVNGVRIDQPTPLNSGDEVRFGRTRMRFLA